MKSQIKRLIKISLFGIIFFLMILISCKPKTYKGFAGNLQNEIFEINSSNGEKYYFVTSDSLVIELGANPTTMQLKYDTIVEEILDEEDFVVVEYNEKIRTLTRVEADNFKFSNIHFPDTKYFKGDTIIIKWFMCSDTLPGHICSVNVLKK